MNKATEIKCIVWDLDNTIWEGVLLESDTVTLKPGIKDIIVELDARGILHSIASKNNHDDAIQQLKEYGLLEYFLYPEINWNAKSVSISNIQRNLNIGFDTMLLIDDQAFERDEVQSIHSDVWTWDAINYSDLLRHERLNPRFITEDSKRRRSMYVEDIKRNTEEAEFQGPKEEFLKSLEIRFIISEACEDDLRRAEELTVRTNQLNATGQIYSYHELLSFCHSPDYKLYVCELIDRYGSYGKIGLALVAENESTWHLKMLLMSCRVLSRSVGSVLLTYIMSEALANGKRMLADLKDTGKNRMMYVTFTFSNFREVFNDGKGTLVLENDLTNIPPWPSYINVQIPESSMLNVSPAKRNGLTQES